MYGEIPLTYSQYLSSHAIFPVLIGIDIIDDSSTSIGKMIDEIRLKTGRQHIHQFTGHFLRIPYKSS